jgi:hypothetical protein
VLTVEQKYIKQLVDQKVASIVPTDICKDFNEYISQNYLWQFTGYRIDWTKHSSYERFNWLESSDEETSFFLQGTCLSRYKEICVIYAADEPGIKVSFEYAKENLDVLMCHTFGTRFLVAIDADNSNDSMLKLSFDYFVEVDRDYWLTTPHSKQ